MAKETKQVEETVVEKPVEQTTAEKQTNKFKVLPVGGLNLRDSSSVFAPVVDSGATLAPAWCSATS